MIWSFIKQCIKAKFMIEFTMCEVPNQKERSRFWITYNVVHDDSYYTSDSSIQCVGESWTIRDVPTGTRLKVELCGRYEIDNEDRMATLM